MTKFILFMYVCSSIAQQCIQGDSPKQYFNSYRDCAVYGYEFSIKVLNNMEEIDVNRYRTTVLFECREEATT